MALLHGQELAGGTAVLTTGSSEGRARAPDPGPAYRETPYGWEPAGAFPPPGPVRPDPVALALQWIQEVIDCGVPPRRAVRYWTYIVSALKRREREDPDAPSPSLPSLTGGSPLGP